jgi:hypothetical protein
MISLMVTRPNRLLVVQICPRPRTLGLSNMKAWMAVFLGQYPSYDVEFCGRYGLLACSGRLLKVYYTTPYEVSIQVSRDLSLRRKVIDLNSELQNSKKELEGMNAPIKLYFRGSEFQNKRTETKQEMTWVVI